MLFRSEADETKRLELKRQYLDLEKKYIDELKANLMDREDANRKRVSALGTSHAQAKYDASSLSMRFALSSSM